ncbi:MAG: PAS domain S-box protein [Chitinophagaceae bacterium]|nr:MAG: PAS domain S-box protein [Chitinophagaceae bacterium]
MVHDRDLSLIMDAANWGLATAFAPEFIISATNEKMLLMLNSVDESVTGRPWREVFSRYLGKTDLNIIENLIANADSSASHIVQCETQPGISATFRFAIHLKVAGEKSLLISAHKDPMEPVNSGVAEENYRRIFEEVQDYAILLLDLDGTILNWNLGAQKLKLYQAQEAIGKNFSMLYLPEDRASGIPQQLLREARLHGRAVSEGKRLRKDNTTFWASITLTALHDDQGEVVGYSKVTRDLTNSKLAEDRLRAYADALESKNEALRKSEERYHSMISEVQDYAIILLDNDGLVLNWNIGAEKIKGYSADEIIGKHFRQFYTEEDRLKMVPEKLLAEVLANGRALHEGWRVRKNGSRFWGSIVITLLHDARGGVTGFSKVTRDLTERKEAEDKMKEYLAELTCRNRCEKYKPL